MAGYGALISGPAQFAGTDQGIDFTGPGKIYAVAPGVVTRYQPSGSGWPGQGGLLAYRVTAGPALGKYIYLAEDFVAKTGIKVGSVISQGQQIGIATGSGQAPGIETGWASGPSGQAVAPLLPHGADYGAGPGADFRSFVQSLGVAPSPLQGGTDPRHPQPGISRTSDAAGNAVGAAAGAVVAPVKAAIGAVSSVTDFLGRLADPNLWIRILEIVGGAVISLAGLYLLVRNVGLGVSVPTPGPTSRVAEAAPAV